MKSRAWLPSAVLLLLVLIPATYLAAPDGTTDDTPQSWTQRLVKTIERHLGHPYCLGCCGPKRFDCSGFVWRVMFESGVRVKRTSARKLYLVLPKANEKDRWQLGTVVFFNRLRHCGLVRDSSLFYHASSKRGTTLSRFDPHWRGKISGFRRIPKKQGKDPVVP